MEPKFLAYTLYEIPLANRYFEFEIAKKSGGVRKIHAPEKRIKDLQQRFVKNFEEILIEIEKLYPRRKSVSHAFKQGHSIITNAVNHRNKRFVFNVDLKDFFPSINFGRVRGFFIKNKNFCLSPPVATVLAQIVCHDGELPQGAPSSPLVSNLIAHILDIYMIRLAKKYKCNYSRYADDLTFSTNLKEFPKKIAFQGPDHVWDIGDKLKSEIMRAGFTVNNTKTRMQYKNSRQMVTGLVVNKKVNVRREYYQLARVMCNQLFVEGEYRIPITSKGEEVQEFVEGSINKLNGTLNFIYHVKNSQDRREQDERKKEPSAISKLYSKFLFYKHFHALNKPLLVCEGKTDNTYLKCALKELASDYGQLIDKEDDWEYGINFFNYSEITTNVLRMEGGSDLKFFIQHYNTNIYRYKAKGRFHPVIVIVDNDKGSGDIFSLIQQKFKLKTTVPGSTPFYHFGENLYVLPIKKQKGKEHTIIEDYFDDAVKELDGKRLNTSNGKIDTAKEISKSVFAIEVVQKKRENIDFSKFKEIFDPVCEIIDHYNSLLTS